MIWKVGDLCVAKSQEFGWRNCEIKRITEEKALVQFLEYEGNEEIQLSDAKPFGPSVVNKMGELVKSVDSASVQHFGGWKVGDSCVAQWEQDESWYNAKILHIFSETEVLVLFTKYGNADFTSVGELKPAGSPTGKIDGDPQKNGLKNEEEIKQWNVGDDCVAQWTEDGVWYRSKILMIAGEDVQVLFTEYGNKGDTTLAELKSPDALDKMEDIATTKMGVEVKQDVWKVGDLCVALWNEDGVWYNSKILKLDGETVLVEFLEYGNHDYTTLNLLKPPGSLDVKDSDGSAKTFSLVDVRQKKWKVGDLCVALWNEDGVWYNSKVLEIKGEKVLVEFVEYGNQDYTALDQLKPPGCLDVNSEEPLKAFTEISKTKWKIGDLCVAQWNEDGVWYNSKILKIEGEKVLVEFVEYGNQDYTTLKQLKSPGTLDVSKIDSPKRLEIDDKWKVDDLCVALWNEDGVWYNSKILKIEGEKVLVEFVEYGNQDYTTLEQLKPPGSLDVDTDELLKTSEVILDKWNVGDLCIAQWNEDKVWYESKIMKIEGKKVLVKFLEYGNEDYTTLSQLRPAASPVNDSKGVTGNNWQIGDDCVALWNEDGVWYNSKILKIDGEKVLVKFIEYGNEDYTTLSQLKPPGSLNESSALSSLSQVEDSNPTGIQWKVGDFCVAKSVKYDQNYNCQIKKINESKSMALLAFIEFSQDEELPLSILKPFGPFAMNQEQTLIEDEDDLSKDININGWKNGDICVAKWNTDNSWYDSKILKIFSADEVLVQFTKYGNADFTKIVDLKPAGSSLANIDEETEKEGSNEESKLKKDCNSLSKSQEKDVKSISNCENLGTEPIEPLKDENSTLDVNYVQKSHIPQLNKGLKKDEDDSVNKSEITHDNDIHQDESNVKQWKIGDFCVAKWQEDNVWYNSKILDIQNGQVRVLFTDYGNQDYTPLKMLKPAGSLDLHGNLKPDHSGDCSDLDKTGQYSDIEETNSHEVGVGKMDGGEIDTNKQNENENDKKKDQKIKRNDLEISNKSDKNPKENVNWKEGDLCVAMWVEDRVWYNSKIMEICGDVVLVKFLDYGNEDYTTISQLKPAGALNDFNEVSGTTEEIYISANHETLKQVAVVTEYNKETMGKDKLNIWKVGDVCLAKSKQDDLWYNSKILTIQGDNARIQFLENGNEDTSSLSQLKPTSDIYSANLYVDSKDRVDRDDMKGKQAHNDSRFYTVRKNDSALNISPNTKEKSEVLTLEKTEAKKQSKISSDQPMTSKMKTLSTFPRHSQKKPGNTPSVPLKSDIETSTKVTTDLSRWKAGDKAAAFWETDKRWRHAIIQEVDQDQAFVICPDEVMVKATWVKVITLKHKSVPIIGLNLMEDEINKSKTAHTKECKSNHETPRIDAQINESKVNQEMFSTSTTLKSFTDCTTKNNLNDLGAVIINQSSPKSKKVEVDKGSQNSLENNKVEVIWDQSQCAPENPKVEAILSNQFIPEKPNAQAIMAANYALQSTNIESILPRQKNPEKTNLEAAKTNQILPEKIESSQISTQHSSDDHLTSGRVKPSLCGYTAGTTVADYRGKFLSLAMTETGSRYLQSAIPGMNQVEIQSLQMELMKNAVNAINHPKATYVIQKLMEVANSDSLDVFVDSVSQHFSWLACNPAGCRVVQKCLVMSSPDQQLRITTQLENLKTLLMLLKNKYGIHVMQASLPLLPVRTLKFIVNSLLGYMVDLGRHPYGTFFVQQLVTLDVGHQVGVNLLVEEILQNVHMLSYDKYGTWLVQALISAPQLEVVLCRLSSWAANNLASIYQNQYAVFMAISLFQRLLSLSLSQPATGDAWSSMVVNFVTSLTDLENEGRPLLITAAIHSVGHLLAREIALQVTKIADFVAKNKVQDIFAKYNIVLKADTFGFLVLKALHGLM